MTDRRSIAIRQTLAAGVALLGVLFVLGKCTACNPLTPADRLAIAHDAVRISVCQQKGRDCKADRDSGVGCFEVYDACIQDAGLR